MIKNFQFQTFISINYKEDLFKKIYYLSEHIKDFHLIEQNNQIVGIEISFTDQFTDFELIEHKINKLILTQFINRYSIPVTRKWEFAASHTYHKDMFSILELHDIAFKMGDGLIGVGETFIKLFNYFDRQIVDIVKKKYNGREYQYPTLIHTSTMKKSGYLEFFPQILMFLNRMHCDRTVDKHIANDIQSDFVAMEYCLPPTMCYHTYQQYENKEFKDNMIITARGKSFRYESKYQKDLERMWDFTIREIVFLGTQEFVKKTREQFMSDICRFMESLNLAGYCETANDPFFIEVDETIDHRAIQLLMQLKYELRLNITEYKNIAVGSFNLHNEFISKAFNLRKNTGFITTGCAGIGIERLTYAFLCQYGIEEEKWPDQVREYLKKENDG